VPTPEEIKRQREYNELLKEEGRIRAEREGRTASDVYTRESVDNAASMVSYAQQLTEDAKEQAGYVRSKAEADKKLVSLARQLSTSATNITAELGREAEVLKQIQTDRKLQRNIEIELANARAQLTEAELVSASKLAGLGATREAQQNKLKVLQDKMSKYSDKELDNLNGRRTEDGKRLDLLKEEEKTLTTKLSKTDELYDLAKQEVTEGGNRVANLQEQFNLTSKLIADREAELKTQKEITKATGVTGAVVEGIGGIMQRLGLRSGIFNQAMADASNEMRKIAGDAKKAGENISKTKVALAGMTKLLGGLRGGLLDPAVIGGAVLKSFFDVNDAATELQRTTGQDSSEIAGMNDRLATSVDFLQVSAELTKEMGMNAQNAFSPKVIAQAAELKNTMGLAANEAAGLATIAQTTVGDVDGVTASVVGTTSAFNKANRSAVSQGVVLKDVATASADIKASLSGNPEALAEAASAARRMGLELSKVDQIASSLMDFESSIEAELEAQLLTGKSINMAKARELALNNDLAGLGKEIFKNSADLNDFGKMNRIQQEAQAKALGISREELGKIAYARAIEAGMTEAQAEAAAGVTAEDMKRLKAQEALQLAVSKLTQAFAPVLNIIGDIANGLATMISPVAKLVGLITSTSIGKVAVATFVAIKAFGGLNSVLGGSISGMKSLVKGFGNYVKNISSSKGILEKAKSLLGIGGGATKDASDKGKEVLDKTKGADTSKLKDPATPGKNIKEFLTNLAEGLKAMGSTKVLGGALNLIPASIGLIAFIPGMVGVKLLEYVNGDKVKTGLEGIAAGLESMASLKTLAGAGVLAVSALGFIAMLPALPAMALLGLVAPIAAGGLAALGPALGAFGTLASPAIPILLTFAALTLSVGAALMMAAPAFEAFGNIIEKAFAGIAGVITAASNGISTILDSVTPQGILSLAALGPALISAGVGLTAFSISTLLAGPGLEKLERIAALSDPLSTVGASLTAMAAGIAAMSAAINSLETEKLEEIKDLVMTTALAAPMVAASGAITSLINGITGGGEGDSNSELLAEIKALRAVVEKGGNINMDGNKVGQYIMLSANKSA
jgi:hypothetical protein